VVQFDDSLWPVNLALIVGGCGVILLFCLRRRAREYLWLGPFLALSGLSSSIYPLAITGVAPLWVNNCMGDPLGYAAILAQIEFTY